MKYKLSASALCLSAMLFSSCLKQEFDSPPDSSQYDPALPVNCTISSITDGATDIVTNKGRLLGDSTFYGIVIGDDRSGNIYKQIYIEDSTKRGIVILLDQTNLYGQFPVGRKVYVKLKGLYLVNYRGLPEIVYSLDTATGSTTGIPSSLVGNYLIAGNYPNKVEPQLVTIPDLYSSPTKYLNTLITLENMQFDNASAGQEYSLSSASTNRTITDCPFSGKLTMYNSSYSKFRAALTPKGKGKITGIFTIYYTTPQFVLRDTTDVQFTDARICP